MARQLVMGIWRDLETEEKVYRHRLEQVRLASIHLAHDEISRICAQHELESDEFLTREKKARTLLC